MARPRKDAVLSTFSPALTPQLTSWAESLGEALGRGVARGINAGIATGNLGGGAGASTSSPVRRRGRPPKAQSAGASSSSASPDSRCSVEGCTREARSKGLCSAHYQAQRRKQLNKQN